MKNKELVICEKADVCEFTVDENNETCEHSIQHYRNGGCAGSSCSGVKGVVRCVEIKKERGDK